MLRRIDIFSKRQDILKWIEDDVPKYIIATKLQCNVKTLNTYLDLMSIDYKGKQDWSKALELRQHRVKFEDYVAKGGRKTQSIKSKLLYEGLIERKCSKCQRVEWLGKPIPLELHHKDGNHDNVELSNLELLCPNCHSLTSTYRGRNCKKIYRCVCCDNIVAGPNRHCKSCAAKLRVKLVSRKVDKETLINDLFAIKNFSAIGRKYGVTDNAVRKWCKSYGLPTHTRDINGDKPKPC